MAGIKPLGLPRPLVSRKPGPHEDMNPSVQLQGASSVPTIRPLPSVFALGKCPAKPKRPPNINCDVFRTNVSNNTELFPPPPPEDLSITSVTPPPPANFTFLPPPPPMDDLILEEQYDDVGLMNTTSSQDKSSNDFQDSGEETYDDVDTSRPERNKEPSEKMKTSKSKDVKKKIDKEEKKRLEQEKKEKKVQEKREQEARKKFKIEGPIVVLATVQAILDHKNGKNKLALKQGETVEIVRKTGNPKNYWLGRNKEGNYGFVKPDAVDECPVINTPNVKYVHNAMEADDNLPAVESDADIYDCPEEFQEDFGFLPPPPPDDFEFNNDGNTGDFVSSTDLHPPISPERIPRFRSRSEMDDISTKNRFEKEEKEFRKKYKYKGEITVLYQATVLPSVNKKKFGNKDLMVKPGEIIDVIAHPEGDKVICRNSDGKFGYVSTANIEEDSPIYDDLGEECIYDND